MKRLPIPLLLLAGLVALETGCAPLRAPRMADGRRLTVFVSVDQGDPLSFRKAERRVRTEAVAFMRQDMVAVLRRLGYDAGPLRHRADWTPGPGRYHLAMTLEELKSAAAYPRSDLGYAAGMSRMKVRFELRAGGDEPVAAGIPTVRFQGDWRDCARSMNAEIATEITRRLRDVLPENATGTGSGPVPAEKP